MAVICGKDTGLIEQMQKAGILPDNCRRVVIDVKFDGLIAIYYEVLGDERLLDIDIAAGIKIDEKEKPYEPLDEKCPCRKGDMLSTAATETWWCPVCKFTLDWEKINQKDMAYKEYVDSKDGNNSTT